MPSSTQNKDENCEGWYNGLVCYNDAIRLPASILPVCPSGKQSKGQDNNAPGTGRGRKAKQAKETEAEGGKQSKGKRGRGRKAK